MRKRKELGENFLTFFVKNNIKVKELIIKPKKGMSFQKHQFRNEIWFISEGSCIVNFSKTTEKKRKNLNFLQKMFFL